MALAKLCSGHSGSACGCRGWRRSPWDIAGAFRDHPKVVLLRQRGWRSINSAMGLGMAVLLHRAAALRGSLHSTWTLPSCRDPILPTWTTSSLHRPPHPCMDLLVSACTTSFPHGPPPPYMDHLLLAGTTSSPHGPPPPRTDQRRRRHGKVSSQGQHSYFNQ